MSSKNTARQQRKIDNYVKGAQREERRRQLKKTNKNMRRNQTSKGSRRKHWDTSGWDDMEAGWNDFERIMPRDESERRRAIEQVAFHGIAGVAENEDGDDLAPDAITGRVIEVSKGLCRVQVGDRVLLCGLRGNLAMTETGYTNAIAVGYVVVITEDGVGGGVVDAVLPRHSALARPDVYDTHLQQVIVANVDQLLVVASWRDPHIWPELIDRYLIVAARNELPVILCINKIDLMQDAAELDRVLKPYRALGCTIVMTSTLTGVGIDQLSALLTGQTTVLAGLSGVGKSSLISAIEPGLELRTGEVSERAGDGRHTTTQANWLPLSMGGAVVDTPGIREFGLSGLHREELAGWFPEFAEHDAGCRFNNCLHISEPDCAVRAAVANGEIAESRYHSYTQILDTLPV